MHFRQRHLILIGLSFLLVALVVGGVELIRYLTLLQQSAQKVRVTPITTPTNPNQLDMSHAYLIIPSIHVRAPVEQVGVTSSGNMDVPGHNPWEDVGWLREGPQPGQPGSAVMDGHLDRPGGSPAVFWDLNKMHVGDSVMVTDTKQHIATFLVTKIASYPPDNAPLNDIFQNNSGSFLNLITCAGAWIPTEHQTTLRLVVYTKLLHY